MIRFDSIRVTFDGFTAIHNLDLHVEPGEFFTLLGPSGCGKTTALRTLAGFVDPSAGDVFVDGRRVTTVPSDKREVGMVFQNYALFPSMSVWENIAFGLKVRRTSGAERDRLVEDMAARVELSGDQLHKKVSELSGGQQQRVAIARALVLKPKILLLDEPLSNLDAKLRHQLRGELKALQSDFGITTVYVTHDQDEALTMSDRIAVFNKGRVEQVGTPQEIYDASASEFVCNFIGDSSSLTPALIHRLNELARRSLLDPAQLSYLRVEKAALDLPGRGDHLHDDGSVTVSGRVTARNYHGQHSRYTVRLNDADIKVLVKEDGRHGPALGEEMPVRINPAHVLQYGATG